MFNFSGDSNIITGAHMPRDSTISSPACNEAVAVRARSGTFCGTTDLSPAILP